MREMSAVVFTHVSPRSTRRGGDDGRSLPRPSLPVLLRTLLAERDGMDVPSTSRRKRTEKGVKIPQNPWGCYALRVSLLSSIDPRHVQISPHVGGLAQGWLDLE